MIQEVKAMGSAFIDKQPRLTTYLPSSNQLMRNINRIALPAIALFVSANAQIASAGPIAWAACIVICEATAAAAAGAAAASLMACVTACGAILPLPFPP